MDTYHIDSNAYFFHSFGYIIDSNIKRIRLYIRFIRKYDEEINSILESMHELVNANEDTDFVKQIHLIETFKGAGFLSAVSLIGEIGDFSAFSKPKLVAMGDFSHKVCNILFAILRDNKPFEIITPQEHIKQYNAAKCDVAA